MAASVERSKSVSSIRRMNCPGVSTRVQPAKQRGPQPADVQKTRWAGSKSGADGHELLVQEF